jgi:small subunit ribosomal protein S17
MSEEDQRTSSEAGVQSPASSQGPGAGGPAAGQHRRKTIIGIVSSDKMRKTRAVRVVRLEKHPKYGKYLRRRTTYYAHDEGEVARLGDTVEIVETRPLSKLKRWRLVKVLSKGQGGAGLLVGEEPGGPKAEGGVSP